jgi:hypothetical protein
MPDVSIATLPDCNGALTVASADSQNVCFT